MTVDESLVLRSGALELRVCSRTGKIEALTWVAGARFAELLLPRPEDSGRRDGTASVDTFTVYQAWGSDECFPSVGGAPEWGLRDHGDLWEKEAKSNVEGKSLRTEWTLSGAGFTRSIEPMEPLGDLVGGFSFAVRFPRFVALENGVHCRSLYAFHALFQAESGNVLRVLESDASGEKDLFRARFPDGDDRQARKLYFNFSGGMVARLYKPELEAEVVVSGAGCSLGIWWCNNGWGDGRDHRTIGIEPTNFPSDGPLLGHPGLDSQTIDELRFRVSLWRKSKP